MARKNIRIFALLLNLALLSGCATQVVFKDPLEPGDSLVLLYINMDEAKSFAQWATAVPVKPTAESHSYTFGWVTDEQIGMIMHNQHVDPGLYQLTDFGGYGKKFPDSGTIFKYKFPEKGKGLAKFRIKKGPSVYFVGSYKYHHVKTGFFEKGKFNIERVDSPTEYEVLTKFLPKMDDGQWKELVLARIAELEKSAKNRK